jgi:streptogramin lyase
MLNGNHELMNVAGDFRYVTAGGWSDFENTPIPERLQARLADLPPAQRGRAAAFSPGGVYANRYATQPLIAQVGDTLFAHGGVLPAHVGRIDAMHRRTQCWLLGQGPAPMSVLSSDDSPVWTRVWAQDPPPCEMLASVLGSLKAERLVIGHTPQPHGIRAACEGRLWLIDVGMAAAYGGKAAALVIEGSRVFAADAR